MLREAQSWIQPGDFVYKTDVYSYYASLNHWILIHQLHEIRWPSRFMESLYGYLTRTVLRAGPSIHCSVGIPKGGSLSPALGALYLSPLDHAMERWMARGDCFYARFQDDIILVSRKRHVLKRMRKEMYSILKDLKLGLRPEKTYMGRSGRVGKGFDLLGYAFSNKGLTPSKNTQEKAFENSKRRYAQGGQQGSLGSLQSTLKQWRAWAVAGLPDIIFGLNEIIERLETRVAETIGRDGDLRLA